ncbi:MAG: hypothetical protein ABSC19_07660 [Syntrophorhabdales bacterium]|jgi:hypothetical protein
MERPDGSVGLGKRVLFGLGFFLLSRLFKPWDGGGVGADLDEGHRAGRPVVRGWLIVCTIAVLFVLYGFLAFYVIGDKGPPDWDYGSLPDVPGQSAYSTYPYRAGSLQPEPQHIGGAPPDAKTAPSAGERRPAVENDPDGDVQR